MAEMNYDYLYRPNDDVITNEIKQLLDHLNLYYEEVLDKIINSIHYQITVNYDKTMKQIALFICFDVNNTNDENVYKILGKLDLKQKPKHSKYPLYLTARGEGSGKRYNTHYWLYECEGFTQAYEAVKVLLPDLERSRFISLDKRLTRKTDVYEGGIGLIKEVKKEVYHNKHTSITVYIANDDIIANIDILVELLAYIVKLW